MKKITFLLIIFLIFGHPNINAVTSENNPEIPATLFSKNIGPYLDPERPADAESIINFAEAYPIFFTNEQLRIAQLTRAYPALSYLTDITPINYGFLEQLNNRNHNDVSDITTPFGNFHCQNVSHTFPPGTSQNVREALTTHYYSQESPESTRYLYVVSNSRRTEFNVQQDQLIFRGHNQAFIERPRHLAGGPWVVSDGHFTLQATNEWGMIRSEFYRMTDAILERRHTPMAFRLVCENVDGRIAGVYRWSNSARRLPKIYRVEFSRPSSLPPLQGQTYSNAISIQYLMSQPEFAQELERRILNYLPPARIFN